MATQQILFAETIAAMKKAFKRKAYESDSDSEIESYTNRGRKLKKKARFAHKGQLLPAVGPSAYKETVDYAGVRRSIIHRNPPIVDEDGYEVESDDDDQRIEEAAACAAELNPYASICLEHILAPLTASTDLPTHPTLSKPFTSQTLTDLVTQSSSIMRKENCSLWQIRHLWTSLCGDSTWVPCGTMVGPNDSELYTDDHIARRLAGLSKSSLADSSSDKALNGESSADNGGGGGDVARNEAMVSRRNVSERSDNADATMIDAGEMSDQIQPVKHEGCVRGPVGKPETEEADMARTRDPGPAETGEHNSRDVAVAGHEECPGASPQSKLGKGEVEMETSRTGDDAAMLEEEVNGVVPPSLASDGCAEEPFIHPVFTLPAGAKLDRDLGLPENEADDIRRLLALYVQKQEEMCRGAIRLHQGLLRADRLRKEVLRWSKAEAHAGPNRDMSDGEDWYDKEEWGLTDDLKKGQDDEEEDAAVHTSKKTRNRR